jgi:DNA-binding response OmpR family regulator
MPDAELTKSFDGQKLLIVEDDMKFCRLISDYLKRFGFDITPHHSGEDAVQRIVSGNWDAVILDVMLPGLDGYEIVRRVRSQSSVPILMLTALGDETDRIVGLEIGADDYLPKTFSPRELLARLRAVLRRSMREPLPDQSTPSTPLLAGPLKINLLRRTVHNDEELLNLTPVEFDLLVSLAQSKGRIKSREQLLNEIRDRHFDVLDRSIDVHISGLRRKLKDDPKCPRFIQTIRSAGYMLIC